MLVPLTLTLSEIDLIEKYLPFIAAKLDIGSLRQNLVLNCTKEELQNLQDAVVDVLSAYGFDENYDVNAVGQIADSLIDTTQKLLGQ